MTAHAPRAPRAPVPRCPRARRLRASVRLCVCASLLSACGGNPRPAAPAPELAADSLRRQQLADSVAAAARRDSALAAARRDSLRADSLARVQRERARADSVRAEVLRDRADTATVVTPSGLDSASGADLGTMIFFEYDRFDLSPEAVATLERKLRILEANPRLEIEVAGHCDERGSDEYNLALGNRRAAAAKRYLVEHGVAEGRITIVSYGEERPFDPGHTEEAWGRNRRAEFTVTRGGR